MNNPKVLFLCTGNSARSQMAEGLLRTMAGEQFEVFSAGTEPKGRILPEVRQAMQEIGIDISRPAVQVRDANISASPTSRTSSPSARTRRKIVPLSS